MHVKAANRLQANLLISRKTEVLLEQCLWATFLTTSEGNALSLSRDGQMLAVPETFSSRLWSLAPIQFKNGRSLRPEAVAAERLLIAVNILNRINSFERLRTGISALEVPLDRSLSISSDGIVVAVSGAEKGQIIVESGATNAASALSFADKFIDAVRFNAKGNLLAIGGRNRLPIYLDDYRTSTTIQELENGKDWISSLASSSDGHAITAGSYRTARRVRV